MKLTNAIFKLMLGTAAIVISFAALSYASKTAHAEPEYVSKPLMQPNMSSGKYNVQYFSGLDGTDKFYWHLCISNTETGKFIAYRWSKDDQDWIDNFGKQVPVLP